MVLYVSSWKDPPTTWFSKKSGFCYFTYKAQQMSWSICMYLLKKFHKLIRGIFIHHYGLQKLKVSCDLEKLVYKVVETPWITPNLLMQRLSGWNILNIRIADTIYLTSGWFQKLPKPSNTCLISTNIAKSWETVHRQSHPQHDSSLYLQWTLMIDISIQRIELLMNLSVIRYVRIYENFASKS